MELAARLREEARRSDQRRLLVLTGDPAAGREQAIAAVETADIPLSETAYVGPSDRFHCESLPHHGADQLLGTSQTAVILDCHDRCEPNTLGKLVGAVSGGGLFILLVPPVSAWPDRHDEFDHSLAVEPFEASAVGQNFRQRLIETLRSHRGVAIVDVDSGTVECDGLTDPPPRYRVPEPSPPDSHRFPSQLYEACRTQDQADAVHALEKLADPGEAVVLEANRGRGKSSAAGLAAASLAREGADVLVTAPTVQSTDALFSRARESLNRGPAASQTSGDDPVINTAGGRIRYEKPAVAAELAESPDCVIVDEAAALPVRILQTFLHADSVAFTTTIHGYEGAGRGFSVRFREHLAEHSHHVTERTLATPIRYAPGDPIEVWSFRALALDARPPVDQLISDGTPETVEHQVFPGSTLRENEHVLSEVFGLLVLAHYRTEPNDLARLLDAPNVSVHCLTYEGHVVAVALLSREGGLAPATRSKIYEGERIRGHLIPDVLTSQLRDEAAGGPSGVRVMRIATHSAVRSRGLGSLLLDRVREHARETGLDWVGVAFGVTPSLARFWDENGFSTVHLSTTRNDRSGEHSAVMLAPLTTAGERLLERHTEWVLRRAPATFRDSLSDVDPDVIRAACRTVDGVPTLDLTRMEWRHAAGMAHGTSIFATAPCGPQRLCFRHLVAPDGVSLSPTEWRVLVRKGLQGQSPERIAREEDFHTAAECMRTVGTIIGRLVEQYGDETARAELRRQSSTEDS